MYLKHLRRNVDDVAFGPSVAARLRKADEFVGTLEHTTNRPSVESPYLHITSKLTVTPLNRLQDDARVCLELRIQVQGRPWLTLEACIPLDGDGSLYDHATASLSDAVYRLAA